MRWMSVLLIGSFSLSAHARTLTESDVLQSVNQHFPLIKAAQASIQKARADYLTAQGAFDPLFKSNMLVSPNGEYKNGLLGTELQLPIEDSGNKAFAGYRIGRGTYPVYDQDRETYNYGEFRVGFEVPFMRDKDIDVRRAKISQAKIGENISVQDYRLTKLKANYDAVISYADWLADGQQLKIQKHMLVLAENRQKALDKSVHVGDVPEIDAIDNMRIILQRQAAVKSFEAIFRKAALVLSLFYRDEAGKPIVPTLDDVPKGESLATVGAVRGQFDHHVDLSLYVDRHPDMELLKQEYDYSMVDLKQGSNNLRPLFNNKIYLAQDMGGGNPPLNKTTINYEMIFEIPVNQRAAKGQIEAAAKEMERVTQERRLQAERISVAIRKSLVEISATRKVIDLSRRETEMALKVENAENTRFRHGDSNLFILNQREIMTAEAEARYVEAVRKYNNAVASLGYSMGADV